MDQEQEAIQAAQLEQAIKENRAKQAATREVIDTAQFELSRLEEEEGGLWDQLTAVRHQGQEVA
jgi:hypothetical protein